MIDVRRRLFLKTGLLGLGALGTPLLAQERGFTHSVASGDPRADGVILWTRYMGSGDEAKLRVEVARDEGFGRIIRRAEAVASGASDFTARAEVTGLDPDRRYFYRFVAPDGTRSPVGRTKTLPAAGTRPFRIAVFSCSNLPFGWFNAYGHAAARDDIDLVVHLGDYIYEYQRGAYPSLQQAMPGRIIEPANEIVALADYRARYASYRRDADLATLHQMFPSVTIWDDHEFTNDAWRDGAQNHQPETEGDWATRKRIARQVNREWLPMRDVPYDAIEIGDLATLIRLDTRAEGRDQQLDLGGVLKGAANPTAALAAFRDGPWSDRERTLLGQQQEAWFTRAVGASVKARQRWQLVAHQVLAGTVQTPKTATPAWLGADAPDYVRGRITAGIAATRAGLPANLDSWGGYPAARARMLRAAQEANANLVMIAGDTHNAWAFDLANEERPAGVEFGGQSVSSPGFEGSLRGIAPKDLAAALVAENAELKWCDTARRGYMTVTLSAEEARCDWHFLETIRERSTKLAETVTARTSRGTNRLTLG
jgi:alkaline phosphatase D